MSEKNWGKILDIETQDASAVSPNIVKRTVFGPENGFWDDYVLRHFILPEGNSVPPHTHDWDHLIISIGGHGNVVVDGEPWDLEQGNWTCVPGGTVHAYNNVGKGDFVFLCIVPVCGDPQAKKFAMRRERKAKKEETEVATSA